MLITFRSLRRTLTVSHVDRLCLKWKSAPIPFSALNAHPHSHITLLPTTAAACASSSTNKRAAGLSCQQDASVSQARVACY